MRIAASLLLLMCACGGSSVGGENAPAPPPPSAPQTAATAEPATQPSGESEKKDAGAPETALKVGTRVLVGAGYIFEEGTLESHECKGGSVVPGKPCVSVRKRHGLADHSVLLVHPIDGHIVKSPAADRFLVCGVPKGNRTAWWPCRTVSGDGGIRCQLNDEASSKPLCSELVVVEVPDRTAKVIEEAFAEAAAR